MSSYNCKVNRECQSRFFLCRAGYPLWSQHNRDLLPATYFGRQKRGILMLQNAETLCKHGSALCILGLARVNNLSSPPCIFLKSLTCNTVLPGPSYLSIKLPPYKFKCEIESFFQAPQFVQGSAIGLHIEWARDNIEHLHGDPERGWSPIPSSLRIFVPDSHP